METKAEKDKRLAAALRENLRRRKAATPPPGGDTQGEAAPEPGRS